MDDILLQRVRYKDKEAFEVLYNQYANYAMRVATAVTKSSALASDAVQETFIRVYYNIDKFKPGRPFEPWLYRILINECNRILKKAINVSYINDHIENGLDVSWEDEHHFEEYEELYRAIEDLDIKFRIPIILKYLKGFKEYEVAEIMDININTVKSRLFKGRQKLKKALGGQGEEEEFK